MKTTTGTALFWLKSCTSNSLGFFLNFRHGPDRSLPMLCYIVFLLRRFDKQKLLSHPNFIRVTIRVDIMPRFVPFLNIYIYKYTCKKRRGKKIDVVHHFVYLSHTMWTQCGLTPQGAPFGGIKLMEILKLIFRATLDSPMDVSGGCQLISDCLFLLFMKSSSTYHLNFQMTTFQTVEFRPTVFFLFFKITTCIFSMFSANKF